MSKGPVELSDDDLVAALDSAKDAKRAQRAFETLFDRHAGLVLGYCTRILKDRNQAEDVAQEVWMKVIKNASQYQARGQFRPWLLTISRTTALNVLRSKKEWLKEFNDMTFDADDDGAGGNHGTPSSESDDGSGRNASDALVAQADRDELRAAIDSLPELQRTAISLRWIEELSYEETAQAMKITVANAKTLLHRGRQNLENHIRSSRSKSKDRLS